MLWPMIVAHFVQIHHYGCVIKTGTLTDIMSGQARLFGLFVFFGKVGLSDKHDYPTALLLNLQLMDWLHRKKHPCKKFLKRDVMLVNEVQGELNFSVLARGQTSNPARSSVEHVSQAFLLTRVQMQSAKDMNHELACEDLAGGSGNIVKDVDVQATAAHFTNVMREFKHGMWRPFLTQEIIKKKGVNKLQFEDCRDIKMKGTPSLFDAQVTLSDMERAEKRAKACITNKGKTWVFEPLHGDLFSDYAPPAKEVKSLNADPGDGEEEKIVGGGDDEPGAQPVPIPAAGAQPKKAKPARGKRKAAVDCKSNEDEMPTAPAKKKKKAKKSGPSADAQGHATYVPIKIHDDREMLGTDELQLLIEWKGFPSRAQWTWEPSAQFIGDDEYSALIQEYFPRAASCQ